MTSVSELNQKHIGKERYGAGDTYLVRDVLPSNDLEGAFEHLCEEVQWLTMCHRGGEVPRLVAVQGTVDPDGTVPIYRHPADESPPLLPFTATVQLIRNHVAQFLPDGHPPLNHVLIQRYRSGEDYISEHADKTVDIVRGSCIVNVSIGAQRRMTLRTKKNYMPEHNTNGSQHNGKTNNTKPSPRTDRITHHIPLPHNSALIMGLETNRLFLHGIRADRRIPTLLTQPETDFNRERISLTFRSIGTFLTPAPAPAPAPAAPSHTTALNEPTDSASIKWLIWGQGARSKTRNAARPVISSAKESAAILYGFGQENHMSDLDWEKAYGQGFDVINYTT
ncbi:hypothetical protein ACEPAG_2718 [Sanghuangporus baumii]